MEFCLKVCISLFLAYIHTLPFHAHVCMCVCIFVYLAPSALGKSYYCQKIPIRAYYPSKIHHHCLEEQGSILCIHIFKNLMCVCVCIKPYLSAEDLRQFYTKSRHNKIVVKY